MAHHLETNVVSNVQKDVISDIFPVLGFVKIGDLVKEITLKNASFYVDDQAQSLSAVLDRATEADPVKGVVGWAEEQQADPAKEGL